MVLSVLSVSAASVIFEKFSFSSKDELIRNDGMVEFCWAGPCTKVGHSHRLMNSLWATPNTSFEVHVQVEVCGRADFFCISLWQCFSGIMLYIMSTENLWWAMTGSHHFRLILNWPRGAWLISGCAMCTRVPFKQFSENAKAGFEMFLFSSRINFKSRLSCGKHRFFLRWSILVHGLGGFEKKRLACAEVVRAGYQVR